MARSIIERAARALCQQAGNPENIIFNGKPMWQSYANDARAILSTMYQPTPVMIEAASKANALEDHVVFMIWETMIEAALVESSW